MGYLGRAGWPLCCHKFPIARHTRAQLQEAGIEGAGSPHHAFGSGDVLRFERWHAPDDGLGIDAVSDVVRDRSCALAPAKASGWRVDTAVLEYDATYVTCARGPVG